MPMKYFKVSDEKYYASSEALTLSATSGILKHAGFWAALSKFITRKKGRKQKQRHICV